MLGKEMVLSWLKSNGIDFEYIEHLALENIENCKIVGQQHSALYFKNLFLQNRQGTEFYLLLLSPDKLFKTADFSKKIGASRLSFGKNEFLELLLGSYPGAVSPLGLLKDNLNKVNVFIDKDIMAYNKVCCHPCDNNATLVLSKDMFIKILDLLNHSYQTIEV